MVSFAKIDRALSSAARIAAIVVLIVMAAYGVYGWVMLILDVTQ